MKPWLALIGCLAAVLVAGPSGRAAESVVTVTLHDGTRLDGLLITQTEEAVTLRQELAGGTIKQTRTIPRTNIAVMAVLGEAETARWLFERASENLRRYRLDPQRSYPAAYYRQVIENVLRPFLAGYPESPEAAAVARQIEQWHAEYRQVAAGRVKYRGRWMDAADARQLMAAREARSTGAGETQVNAMQEPPAAARAPSSERETDWDTPRLLRQLRNLWVRYWPALAFALVVAVWYATRKLGH